MLRYPGTVTNSQTRALFGLVFFIVVAFGLPCVIVLTTDNSNFGMKAAVAGLAVLYFGFRLAGTVSDIAVAPVATTFWTFSYISFGIVPLAQVQTGRTSLLGIGANDDTFYLGFCVVLVGSFIFDLSYRYFGTREGRPLHGPTHHLEKPDNSAQVVETSFSLPRVRMLAVAAFCFTGLYIQTAGGIGSFFASREELGEGLGGLVSENAGQSVRAIVGVAGTVPILFVMLFYLFVRKLGTKLFVADYILFAGALALNLVVNNPIVNPRYWFLAVVFGAMLAALRLTSLSWSVAVLFGLFVALILFPISDIFRYDSRAPTVAGVDNVWEMISVKDYDQFTMLQNTLLYVDSVGVNYFFSLLGCLLFWIPRPLWPNKPVDTGVSVGEFIHSSNTNLSSPLWAEAWVNGSWVGVVVFAVLFGWMAVRLDDRFHRWESKDNLGFILLASVLSGYMFILMRGPLLQSMSRLACILVVAWLFSRVVIPTEPPARFVRRKGRRVGGRYRPFADERG